MSKNLPLEFLKLTTGENIVGKIERPDTDTNVIRIHDPLAFETGAQADDMSRRYVYMSRYVPFLHEQIIDIDMGKVMFHAPPSASIARYYEASLAFCRRQTDADFEGCLNATSHEMESAVSQMDMENAVMDSAEIPVATKETERATREVLRNMFLAAMPVANTVH